MKRAAFALAMLALALLTLTVPAFAAQEPLADQGLEEEVRQGFEEILDLWREGKYVELYDRTSASGRETREAFAGRLAAAPLKPACCWEKLQEVSVSLKSDTYATLRGRIGFDGPGNTEYKTKAIRLRKEGGVWRVTRSELFNLAEAGKKKRAKRHTLRSRHS